MKYLLAFSMVFIIVYFLIPYLSKISLKINFVDRPTERKKHKAPVPLLGGLGIFIAFTCGYFVFMQPMTIKDYAIIVASFLVLSIGIIDDFYKTNKREFPVFPRVIVHILASIIVFKAGIAFYGFKNPLSSEYIVLPIWLQFILSIMWIFGVTTVINFSDGMDGLAGGLSAISGITLFVVALDKGQTESAMIAILLVGALMGFLKYNKHPAKIFMGDSGANFLGFILAIIALDGAFKQTTVVSLLIPIFALGVPIFDNLFVVIKRYIDGRPIYKADATQIHHRLEAAGLSQKQVVAFLWLVSICLSLVSIILLLLKV